VLTFHQWNGFVKLLPLWLAPNMVTLLGFFCILANICILEIYIPDLVGPVGLLQFSRHALTQGSLSEDLNQPQGPSWVYFSFAIGLWMWVAF
jgi:ethanolaminephosphotransferase